MDIDRLVDFFLFVVIFALFNSKTDATFVISTPKNYEMDTRDDIIKELCPPP